MPSGTPARPQTVASFPLILVQLVSRATSRTSNGASRLQSERRTGLTAGDRLIWRPKRLTLQRFSRIPDPDRYLSADESNLTENRTFSPSAKRTAFKPAMKTEKEEFCADSAVRQLHENVDSRKRLKAERTAPCCALSEAGRSRKPAAPSAVVHLSSPKQTG